MYALICKYGAAKNFRFCVWVLEHVVLLLFLLEEAAYSIYNYGHPW